jgi:hypothetical protein
MREHVWKRVFLAQEKQKRSSVPMLRMEVQPLKEALPEGGSITVHFAMLSAPRVNWLARDGAEATVSRPRSQRPRNPSMRG